MMGCHKHRDDFDNDDLRQRSESCVREVVRAIRDIQDAKEDDDCRDCKDCFAEPLGDLDGPRRRNADTRVITLTTKEGKPFFAFFDPAEADDNDHCRTGCVSIFFRVEDVFDSGCARLRVLLPLDHDFDPVNLADDGDISLKKVCKVENFKKTRSCVTVDLNDFLAVQCIKDVDLNVCR
ncbi:MULTISPECIES: CotY/CotZ family spore coat protein [Bacillaceae]